MENSEKNGYNLENLITSNDPKSILTMNKNLYR